jgi:TolB protein
MKMQRELKAMGRLFGPGLVWLLAMAVPLAAQQRDTSRLPPGVELATRYTVRNRPALAVQPFASASMLVNTASDVTRIVENDLRISDRFEVRPTPQTLANGTIDYQQWNSLNVVWVVAGELTATTSGFRLDVTLHDVVFGKVQQRRSFTLPTAASPDFRMAIHAASDELVRWIFNQPGMAASRIAFVRQNGNGKYDLLLVDSDGENVRRIAGSDAQIYSPTWSPDGNKLAYVVSQDQGWQLIERDLETGRTRVLQTDQNLLVTPHYSPDGSKIAFANWLQGGLEIQELNVGSNSVRRLTNSAGDNMSPSYSPDGQRITFHSTRTGRQHIYVMPAEGGNATVLSPFGDGVEYAAPDWSASGTEVVFHGRSRGGVYQIMLANASRSGGQVEQLTREGENEDPSWAPDGRHVVYSSGVRGRTPGLYVIDTGTGNIRSLVTGARLRIADWSPSLAARFGAASH